MNIGYAVEALQESEHVTRTGWNGKGMYLYLVPKYGFMARYVAMSTVDGTTIPWLCSQTDLLAEDWEIV